MCVYVHVCTRTHTHTYIHMYVHIFFENPIVCKNSFKSQKNTIIIIVHLIVKISVKPYVIIKNNCVKIDSLHENIVSINILYLLKLALWETCTNVYKN